MAFKIKNASPFFLLLLLLQFTMTLQEGSTSTGGHWVQLQRSIGISAMHMQVMYDKKVVIFDRTDFGPSNISLSGHRCCFNPRDRWYASNQILPNGKIIFGGCCGGVVLVPPVLETHPRPQQRRGEQSLPFLAPPPRRQPLHLRQPEFHSLRLHQKQNPPQLSINPRPRKKKLP